MEGINLYEIISVVAIAAAPVLTAVVAYLLGRIGEIVKATDATWDDELYEAFVTGLQKGGDEVKERVKTRLETKGAITDPAELDEPD